MKTSIYSELKDLADMLDKKNRIIYDAFRYGMRQKEIANMLNLSESRVKAICGEERRK